MAKNLEREVLRIIKSQKTCVVGSIDSDGVPNIKAMLRPRRTIDIHVIYFSTNTSSEHVRQYLANPKASVYFYRRLPVFKGMLLKGTMDILTDSDVKRALWEKGDEKYYSEGVGDADYCVMRFTASKGRIYSRMQSRDFDLSDARQGLL